MHVGCQSRDEAWRDGLEAHPTEGAEEQAGVYFWNDVFGMKS